MNITKFTEGKFYVMWGQGKNWSDYEEFHSSIAAVEHMKSMCTEWASPEHYNCVLTHFKNGVMNLFKDDNDRIVNGNKIYWKDTVVIEGEVVFSDIRK